MEPLWLAAKESPSIYVSISTKRAISLNLLTSLDELNQYLTANQKGFIKISVSVTTKHMLERIEPDTDDYRQRQLFFDELQRRGFQTSLIIKPVLPFIDTDEYREIIADFPSCELFMLGDLYVDERTDFYRTYVEGKYELGEKTVNWLDSSPRWRYVVQDEKVRALADYIQRQGKRVFFSDADLIQWLAETTGKDND